LNVTRSDRWRRRYIVLQRGKAEVAFTVIDRYQGHGIGTALMCRLAEIARAAGLTELIAEILPEIIPDESVREKWASP
jgi:GNAT superfamily N-acetyltransferase